MLYLIHPVSVCLIDEILPVVAKGQRLHERGRRPNLVDSEVITMEVVALSGTLPEKPHHYEMACHRRS